MLITETFHSIQGEGPLTGVPMFFVRTNRCNLRCTWCDSTYTFTGGSEIPISEIIKEAVESWEHWICLTGGEPLLQKEAPLFVRDVTGSGKHVLIETGGSLSIDNYVNNSNTVIDMDIKTPSSGEENSLNRSNLELLRPSDYIKFVISDMKDYEYSRSFLVENEVNCPAIFQPAYGTDYKWIAENMLNDKINARFMLQTHKHVWSDVRGK